MRIDRVEFAAALARKDLTLKELSKMTGLSRSTLTAVKGGKSCNAVTGQVLAAVLGEQVIKKEEG